MAEGIITATTASWDKDVLQSEEVVMVDFWAVWCGPCRMIAPAIEELAKEYEGKVKVVKLNTDENPDIASKYKIMGIPTIMFFKNGEKLDQVVGAVPKPQLKAKLDSGVELVKQKMKAGKLEGRLGQVQMLGRLLSTRHRSVQLAARGRLLIPEGFRDFLGVEPGGEMSVVGAAVCIEIWKPAAWVKYLAGRMPKFRRLFDHLSQ